MHRRQWVVGLDEDRRPRCFGLHDRRQVDRQPGRGGRGWHSRDGTGPVQIDSAATVRDSEAAPRPPRLAMITRLAAHAASSINSSDLAPTRPSIQDRRRSCRITRASACRDRRFDVLRSRVQRRGVDVARHDAGTGAANRVRGTDEADAGHHDFVADTDPDRRHGLDNPSVQHVVLTTLDGSTPMKDANAASNAFVLGPCPSQPERNTSAWPQALCGPPRDVGPYGPSGALPRTPI